MAVPNLNERIEGQFEVGVECGGGGGAPEPYEVEKILCPNTFSFVNTATNWQAAGVLNYRLTVVDVNTTNVKHNTIFFNFEVGMPKVPSTGLITPAKAQDYTTIAANKAEQYIATNHGPDFFLAGAQTNYLRIFV